MVFWLKFNVVFFIYMFVNENDIKGDIYYVLSVFDVLGIELRREVV